MTTEKDKCKCGHSSDKHDFDKKDIQKDGECLIRNCDCKKFKKERVVWTTEEIWDMRWKVEFRKELKQEWVCLNKVQELKEIFRKKCIGGKITFREVDTIVDSVFLGGGRL